MTRTAREDVRSALRQLRGCIGRLAMVRTATLGWTSRAESVLIDAQNSANDTERRLLALLGAEGSTKR